MSGRWNLLDALIVGVLLVCVVGGYGLWYVFRVPVPTVHALDPAVIEVGVSHVRVRGANLRPYLRATLGTERAMFALEDPSTGLLTLPQLAPGNYDLALYDVAQEVARRYGALTVRALPPPPTPPPPPPPTPPPGSRFVRESEDEVILDQVPLRLSVVRDRLTEMCAIA